MNFFENQELARRKTLWLVLYFIIAIVCIILAINLLLTALIYFTDEKPSHFLDIFLGMSAFVSPIIILVILLGSLFKYFRLRHGGISVAEMLKARELDRNTNDFKEMRFLHVVEEMSIASGVNIPQLYILDNETSINAFVAGLTPEDTVMVITKGALDNLNRDELQGVIGHEFSHILNSDMQINVRLIAVIAGLLLVGKTGEVILRHFRFSRSSRSNSNDRSGLVILLFAIGMMIVGAIGIFFGRLIKAAVSRQRELLADAASVAFTRNPLCLIQALKRIDQNKQGTFLQNDYAEDVSHLCFCPSLLIHFQDMLATHPPLADRIARLDPNHVYRDLPLPEIEIPESKTKQDKDRDKNKAQKAQWMMGGAVLASTFKQSVGQLTETHLQSAHHLMAEIPEFILNQAHDPAQLEDLLTELMAGSIQPESIQIPIVDIALATFKTLSPDEQQHLLNHFAPIQNNPTTLFQFMLMTLLINATHPPPSRRAAIKSLKKIEQQLAYLISMVVFYAAEDETTRDALYETTLASLINKPIPRMAVSDFAPSRLAEVLEALKPLVPLHKARLMNALTDCVTQDGKISIREAELIRAIGTALNWPIPPIFHSSG